MRIFFIVLSLLILSSPFIVAQEEKRGFWEWFKSLFGFEKEIQIQENLTNSSIIYKNFTLNFYSVSEKDKEIFVGYLNQTKDYWFYGVKTIKVYGNRDISDNAFYYAGCREINKKDTIKIGCNHDGNISLYFKASDYGENDVKRFICHELLHNHISGIDLNIEEKIVQDIVENPDVCFK